MIQRNLFLLFIKHNNKSSTKTKTEAEKETSEEDKGM